MRDFERALKRRLKSHVPDLGAVTPGLVIEVIKRGEVKAHLRIGQTYQYYDLASLTKIIFSATAWMRWMAKSGFDERLPAYYFLPWWRHRSVTVKSLLTHSAGLTWWKPYYRHLRGPLTPESRWRQLPEFLTGRPGTTRKAVYSDLDLFMLGFVLEELEQKSLLQIWNEIRADFNLEHTQFNEGNRPHHARALYAPTELCPWRERKMQGEVHDENAWALGGVAPHAGLFSDVGDVTKWALHLRKALRGESSLFGGGDTAKAFTERQISRTVGDWGYLFMKPSQTNPSCGRSFSKKSFGHTGFTGTSLWIDPVRDLIVVILSNRIDPTRLNRRFLHLRPQIHDWICELL